MLNWESILFPITRNGQIKSHNAWHRIRMPRIPHRAKQQLLNCSWDGHQEIGEVLRWGKKWHPVTAGKSSRSNSNRIKDKFSLSRASHARALTHTPSSPLIMTSSLVISVEGAYFSPCVLPCPTLPLVRARPPWSIEYRRVCFFFRVISDYNNAVYFIYLDI